MSNLAPHLYTFKATNPAPSSNAPDAAIAVVKVTATSPARAEAAIADQLPHIGSVVLTAIEPLFEPCGDERCAVCYPSSRNARKL